MKIPYRITPNSVTVVVNGRTHNITRDTPLIDFDQLTKAIKDQDFGLVQSLIDPKTSIIMHSEGRAKIMEDGTVQVDGIELHPVLVDRMKFLIKEGYDFKPLARFISNLSENPIPSAVDELFLFLEKCDLAITDDGHFIAYKKVNVNYKDIYSNSIDNSVGCLVSVPESEVDTDRNRTCSAGLHFCSEKYLDHYGSGGIGNDRTMLLKINPKDVRAIPSDYDNAKGRATKYLVIGEVGTATADLIKNSAVVKTTEVEETKDVTKSVGLRNEATVTKVAAVSGTSKADAVKAGYVVGDKVKLVDGKAVLFTSKDAKAVTRSWETKSVKAAVRTAMASAAPVAVVAAPKVTAATVAVPAPKMNGAMFTRAELFQIFKIKDNIEFDRIRLTGSKFIEASAGLYRIV